MDGGGQGGGRLGTRRVVGDGAPGSSRTARGRARRTTACPAAADGVTGRGRQRASSTRDARRRAISRMDVFPRRGLRRAAHRELEERDAPARDRGPEASKERFPPESAHHEDGMASNVTQPDRADHFLHSISPRSLDDESTAGVERCGPGGSILALPAIRRLDVPDGDARAGALRLETTPRGRPSATSVGRVRPHAPPPVLQRSEEDCLDAPARMIPAGRCGRMAG
jgi:hypothetical protein